MAADVVSYSRLMGTDEVGTLRTLKAHRRDLIDPAIAGHHGRIVKTTGDGMLVEFATWLTRSPALSPSSVACLAKGTKQTKVRNLIFSM